jgi:peptidoglycan-associated lipoprotein
MQKILSVVLIVFLSACASKTTKPDGPEGSPEDASLSQQDTSSGSPTVNPLTDPSNILSKRSVYFDFDKYVVKDKYNSMVLSHARYLRENSNASIRLEGNADERGSREYNLALGQRRADSVKRVMTLAGTQESQIESVSYGEEKPRAVGHNETAWAENRRADIRYQGE